MLINHNEGDGEGLLVTSLFIHLMECVPAPRMTINLPLAPRSDRLLSQLFRHSAAARSLSCSPPPTRREGGHKTFLLETRTEPCLCASEFCLLVLLLSSLSFLRLGGAAPLRTGKVERRRSLFFRSHEWPFYDFRVRVLPAYQNVFI